MPGGVTGTVSSGGVKYKYAEVAFGTNRGIRVSAETGARGSVTYKFTPNPHNADSKWYNKNQAAFYQQAATAIVALTTVAGGNATFPAYGTQIEVHGVDYALSDR